MLLSGLISPLPLTGAQPLGGELTAPDPAAVLSSLPSVDAGQGTPDFYGDLAALGPVASSSGAAAHGVAATGAATAPIAASSAAAAHGVASTLSSTAPVAASSAAAAHGVAGGVAAAGRLATSSSTAAHGVAGTLSSTAPIASSSGAAVHGVAGALAAAAPIASSSVSATHSGLTLVTCAISATAPVAVAMAFTQSFYVSTAIPSPQQVGGQLIATAPRASCSATASVKVGAGFSALAPVARCSIAATAQPWVSASRKAAAVAVAARQGRRR